MFWLSVPYKDNNLTSTENGMPRWVVEGILMEIYCKRYLLRCMANQYLASVHLTLYLGLFQTGYSVVSACVIALRWKDKAESQVSSRWTSAWREGVICLVIVACCGFITGLLYRLNASFIFMLVAIVIAVLASAALCFRQVSIA